MYVQVCLGVFEVRFRVFWFLSQAFKCAWTASKWPQGVFACVRNVVECDFNIFTVCSVKMRLNWFER